MWGLTYESYINPVFLLQKRVKSAIAFEWQLLGGILSNVCWQSVFLLPIVSSIKFLRIVVTSDH